MLHSLQSMLAPAFAERLTLILNHVLASEAVATARLRPHAGRTVVLRLEGWPALLPAPPQLGWRITPAGLLEWMAPGAKSATAAAAATTDDAMSADLNVHIDASNPAAMVAHAVAGEMPAVQVDGDAQLASDVNWLLQNLRWDVAADLERLFGPVVAQQLHQLGQAFAGALRGALRLLATAGERLRPR